MVLTDLNWTDLVEAGGQYETEYSLTGEKSDKPGCKWMITEQRITEYNTDYYRAPHYVTITKVHGNIVDGSKFVVSHGFVGCMSRLRTSLVLAAGTVCTSEDQPCHPFQDWMKSQK